jgi:hypothetical protein
LEKPPVQFPWEIPPQIYGPFQVKPVRKDGKERNEISGLENGTGYTLKDIVDVPSIPRGKIIINISTSIMQASTKFHQGLSSAVRYHNNDEWFRVVPPRPMRCSLRIYWRLKD